MNAVCLGFGLLVGPPVRAQVLSLARQPGVHTPAAPRQEAAKPLKSLLKALGQQYNVTFSYESALIRDKAGMLPAKSPASLEEALKELLGPVQLEYRKIGRNIYVIFPAEKKPAVPGGASSSTSVFPESAAAVLPDIRVSGRVIDYNNDEGLPGVNVTIKGTTTGTTTGPDGGYDIRVPDEQAVLVFSFIGYTTEEITVGSRSTLDVQLVPNVESLGEVVVVGYGTQRKVNLTGAVSTVSEQNFEGRPVTNVTQALQGAAPNLIVQQNSSEPGAPLNINIRGVGTLGNASPLVVIDGIPGSLDALNPNDIESVSVLKDAASAAIYGSRAANGVLLVTTKKGAQNTKATVNYNGMYGFQAPTFLQKPVSGYEFAQLKNEALVNSGQAPQFTPGQIRQFHEKGSEPWYLGEIIRNRAPQQNHNLSISGGTKTTNYLFSLGYLNQASFFRGPDYRFNRYNVRLALSNQVSKRLRVGGIVAFARTDGKEHAYFTEWLMADASRIPRIYPLVDSLGRYVVPPSSGSNPLARLKNGGERTNVNDNVYGNLNAEYTLFDGLKVRGVLGGDLWNNRGHEFRKSIDYAPYAGGDNESSVREEAVRTMLTNAQLLLNYEKSFGNHAVQGLLGYSSEGYNEDRFAVRRINIPGNDFGVINNGTQTDDGGTNGTGYAWALNSVFGRLNYAFADKYLLEANFRYDGSSRFAEGNRWGFFPSVSAGWRVTEEPFLAGIRNAVGNLKLRASWGQLGNQNIGFFRYLSTISLVTPAYSFNNQAVPGAYFNVANRDITWETATMTNLGADADLLGNKLSLSFDYFHKLTDNILIDLPVPGAFGGVNPVAPDNSPRRGQTPTQNAAVVKNEGWEVAATWRHEGNGFNHSLTLNLADNLNTVVDTKGKVFGAEGGGDRKSIIREGYPIGSYFGYKSDGFYQNLEETQNGPKPGFVANGEVKPGDIRYVDRNGDGAIDEQDRFVLGNPFPRYTYGASYSVAWKGLDLLLFLQGVGKRSLYLRGEAVEAFHNNWENVYEQHLDRWTPTNPDATYPRLTIGGASTNNNAGSDFWLQNAAYVRLKNVQLGYSLPAVLTRKAGLERVRFYLTGQNLATLTRMKVGFDPEVTEFNNSLQTTDGKVSSGRIYPNFKTYAVGLDVRF
jgi:TonB-linked SusC/RagA family outer membrane protein